MKRLMMCSRIKRLKTQLSMTCGPGLDSLLFKASLGKLAAFKWGL